MKYCENCGKELKPNVNFCEGCGKSLKIIRNLKVKIRPTFLKVWLILIIIGNVFSLVYSLIAAFLVPLILISIPIVIANLVCIWALFNWKKWGFYGYIIIGIFSLFLNYYIFSGIEGALVSLIGAVIGIIILYFAMKPVWEDFE